MHTVVTETMTVRFGLTGVWLTIKGGNEDRMTYTQFRAYLNKIIDMMSEKIIRDYKTMHPSEHDSYNAMMSKNAIEPIRTIVKAQAEYLANAQQVYYASMTLLEELGYLEVEEEEIVEVDYIDVEFIVISGG
jgi:hypothetical protein